METTKHSAENAVEPLSIKFRKPQKQDGIAIYELVKNSPPLDLNSSYLYFLQSTHFAQTCVVAELDNEIVGFVSGYFRPDAKDSLFVWQIVVSAKARGQGLGKQLLFHLLKNQQRRPIVREICCTISPSNKASQKLFESYAKDYQLIVEKEAFLEEADFGTSGHEPEEIYRLRAPYNENLINTLF